MSGSSTILPDVDVVESFAADTSGTRKTSRYHLGVADLRRIWPGWRDTAAAALLIAATWHLVARDGGRGIRDLAPVLLVAAIALVACWPELRSASRTVRWLAIGWAASPLLAVAAATVRAGMTRPVMVASLAVPVWFATVRIWRRPWGPAFLGTLLAATAIRSFYTTFLAWWGGGGASSSQWLALSWHNQAGALTGALGVAGFAVALVAVGRLRSVAVTVGATGLAGAWLSGSRGAFVVTAVALLVVGVGSIRSVGWRRSLAGFVFVLVSGGVLVAGLTGMNGTETQPLAARDESAAGNLQSRFGHWEAAVAMAVDAPLTGQGPGSYRWAALERYPVDTVLTSSAHNEYIEVLGERGLLGAAPVWLAALALGWIGLQALRGTGPAEPVRRAGQLAALGAVAVLGLHAGMDFDWSYPVLLSLLTIGGAVLQTELSAGGTSPSASVDRAGTGWSIGAVGLLSLAAGLAVAIPMLTGTPEPWQLDARLGASVVAARDGDLEAARQEIEAVRGWNPGAFSLHPVTAIVGHTAGELDDDELLAAVRGPRGAAHRDQLLVAERLIEVEAIDHAWMVLSDLRVSLSLRRVWGVTGNVERTSLLQLRAAAGDAGCPEVRATWAELQPWIDALGADPGVVTAAWNEPDQGCRITTPRVG